MIKRIPVLLAFIAAVNVSARQNVVDSVMHSAVSDSLKVAGLNSLFLEYEFVDLTIAGDCLDKAFGLSRAKGLTDGEAMTSYHAGFFAEDKGNYPEAIRHYFAAMKIWEKSGKRGKAADASFCVGNVYYLQEDYAEARIRYNSALEVYKELGDKTSIANSYNNLGGVYMHQQNYLEALRQYSQGLSLRLELGEQNAIADSYVNIGNVYSDQKMNDTALARYFQGLKIIEGMGRKGKVSGIYSNIGIVYMAMKKFKEAREYLGRSIELGKEFGVKETLRNSYKGLSELDSAMGDFRGARENYRSFLLYRDSLDNEETRNRMVQEQLVYDFDKKEAVAQAAHEKELENQQALAEEKSRKQNTIIFAVSVGILFVLGFSAFVSRSLRVTRRQKNIIEEQKEEVELKKKEAEHQKELIEEKQKEIIDSIYYAKRIQRSQMATEKYIDQSISRLRKK